MTARFQALRSIHLRRGLGGEEIKKAGARRRVGRLKARIGPLTGQTAGTEAALTAQTADLRLKFSLPRRVHAGDGWT